MIYKDELGLVVDSTGDAGDSCNFTCGYWLIGPGSERPRPGIFFNKGKPIRHPLQKPWNNPKNFTRDQAIPLTPFLSSTQARLMFWNIVKRFGFMPNTERDIPGSTKYPWPRKVYDPATGKTEWRYFDFADFSGPAYLGSLVLQARLWPIYPLVAIGWTETLLKILLTARTKTLQDDTRQLYTLSLGYGLNNVLEALHPYGVGVAAQAYWSNWRSQPEMGILWTEFVNRNYVNSKLSKLDPEDLRRQNLPRKFFALLRLLF